MKSKAFRAILSLGIVSLLGDIVYESSRGLIPEYMKVLGASAFLVGAVTGTGELLGLSARLVSGEIADRKGIYWGLTFLGYGLIIFIPLLAFSWCWQIAAVFILAERLGKAIRSPARDVILSVASRGIGSGKAFGIHEFLDQLGAILGPLLMTAIMLLTGNYTLAFAFLFCPFFLMLIFLMKVKRTIGPVSIKGKEKKGRIEGRYFIYVLAIMVNTIAIFPAPLLLFKAALMSGGEKWAAPLLYTIIQLVDAPSALLAGIAYDKVGAKILVLPFALSAISSAMAVISENLILLAGAAIVFGTVLGMQESIYRSAVADFTPLSGRGRAYGVFNTVYGVAILLASVIFGAFIDRQISMAIILAYVAVAQGVAIIMLMKALGKRSPE
ncbi:MAG: MFS transporter [Candidatus Hadarchaeales archaeon]